MELLDSTYREGFTITSFIIKYLILLGHKKNHSLFIESHIHFMLCTLLSKYF